MMFLRTLSNVVLVVALLFGPAWVVLAAEIDLEEGLVLYYPFEGNDDEITDESGENNHGAFDGAIRTEDGEGKFGKAIVFPTFLDGVKFDDSESLLVTTGFTVSIWVYPIEFNFGGNGENRMIYRPNQYNIDLLLGKGRMEIRSKGVWHQVAMGPVLQQEEWAMVTGSWSEKDGEGKLWRDGIVVKKNANVPEIEEGHGVTSLGFMGLEAYAGRMDEVRIWNRALSEDEMEALFTMEDPGSKAVSPKGKLATMWGSVKYYRQ